jgi:hypothetical protein
MGQNTMATGVGGHVCIVVVHSYIYLGHTMIFDRIFLNLEK